MRNTLPFVLCSGLLILAHGMSAPAHADELTQQLQMNLVKLGYDPGSIDGEATTATAIAVSQYQADRDMPVTGAISPMFANLVATDASKIGSSGSAAVSTDVGAAAPVQDPDALRAAQEKCLQDKVAAAQSANKTKRGFGKLIGVIARTASRHGNHDVSRTASDVYRVNADASDLASAAKDLGLTEDEVQACQNPG